MDLSNYNIHEVEPMGTFEPLPADWYRCVIADTEERQRQKSRMVLTCSLPLR